MEITLKKNDPKFSFTAFNEDSEIKLCATPALEEGNTGFRPMQLMLVSLAGCMSIDVLSILYKQKQLVEDYEVKVSASRTDEIPAIFKEIEIHLHIVGDIPAEKIQRAISLSEEKYCSVHKIMGQSAKITTKFTQSHV